MSFANHNFTSNGGSRATNQAPREFGDSKKFSKIRDVSRICKKINPLHRKKGDRHSHSHSQKPLLQPGRKQCSPYNHTAQGRSRQWKEFRRLYRDRRLTDCLQVLEEQGFAGDSAIFILTLAGGAEA